MSIHPYCSRFAEKVNQSDDCLFGRTKWQSLPKFSPLRVLGFRQKRQSANLTVFFGGNCLCFAFVTVSRFRTVYYLARHLLPGYICLCSTDRHRVSRYPAFYSPAPLTHRHQNSFHPPQKKKFPSAGPRAYRICNTVCFYGGLCGGRSRRGWLGGTGLSLSGGSLQGLLQRREP